MSTNNSTNGAGTNKPGQPANPTASIKSAGATQAASPAASISSSASAQRKSASRKGRWVTAAVVTAVGLGVAAASYMHNKLEKRAEQAHTHRDDALRAYDQYKAWLNGPKLPRVNTYYFDIHKELAQQLATGEWNSRSLDVHEQRYVVIPKGNADLGEGCVVGPENKLLLETFGFIERRTRWEGLRTLLVTLPKGLCGSDGSKLVPIPFEKFGQFDIPPHSPAPVSQWHPTRNNNVRVTCNVGPNRDLV